MVGMQPNLLDRWQEVDIVKNKTSASKRLINYAKMESKNLTGGIICTFIRTALEIVGPLIIGHLLNNYIKKGMLPISTFLFLYKFC